jgi:pyruvate formate lyase activating enzyme
VRKAENNALQIDREKCIACGKCVEICLNDANEFLGKEMTASEVMDEVLKDKMFYATSGGGITVTGGEPSYQADFTLELLRLSKDAGISSAIETCGIGSRDFYKDAADLGTTFLYDLKCIDPARHRELTGADNAHILSNLKYLMDRNADIIIRLPMIPECNDRDEDIASLANFLNSNKGCYRYAEIMPYHSLGTDKADKIGAVAEYTNANATEAQISRWCLLFNSHGIDVRVSK